MVHYIVICRSLTSAQRITKLLEHSGISAAVIRPPAALYRDGCSYSVKISERRFEAGMAIIKNSNISYGKVYKFTSDGTYFEV